MPDLTIPMDLFVVLAPALVEINTLKPPPSPKGRYVLQKALDLSEKPLAEVQKAEQALIRRGAVKDDTGNVLYTPTGKPGELRFEWMPELHEECEAERAALMAALVTLTGLRAITHAELGACPITGAQERLLIKVGLLEDAEPA